MNLSCSKLGNMGRAGNQLFQLASMTGLSRSKGCDLALPSWKYAKYFKGPIPGGSPRGVQIKEPAFHYCGDFIPNDRDYDVVGYLQSPRYWEHCEKEVRDMLTWEPKFLASIKRKYAEVFKKKTIAISCRVGDYRNNENYHVLPAMYYFMALCENFPDWKQRNILFVSDDIEWAKLHFGCLPNAYFATNFEGKDYWFDETAVEQLCVASLCDDFILSNSTFAWWAGYLSTKQNKKVVRPAHYMAGKLKKECDMKDFWPKEWVEFDHKGKKFDLRDVTFTIPVFADSNDRKQNLGLSLCMIQRDFDCEVIVGEQGGSAFAHYQQWAKYVKFPDKAFHRTKFLNVMCRMATTKIVVNFDCDAVIPPVQTILAVEAIRNGEADFVYNYDGRFARCPRVPWFKLLERHLDAGIMAGQNFNGTLPGDLLSLGGCVMYDKQKFIEAGMENENFISWTPEDLERYERWVKLGYKVKRIGGILFHLDHITGVNSSGRNPHFEAGKKEYDKVLKMSKKELKDYVSTWKWLE